MNAFAEFAAEQQEIEARLEHLLPSVDAPPQRLHEALHYCVLAGGKRIRPLLVLLAGELWGADREALLHGGAALELLHTFSLVHDDLPALDDDDLRRGRPTLHRRYDEALAVLAGDALLARGLGLLAEGPPGIEAGRRASAVALAAAAVGSGGMIGGQVEDLAAERAWPADAAAALERIHRGKTAALITAALRLGGLYAGVDAGADTRLRELGEAVGLLFQIADDMLDAEGSSERLGKAAGKDLVAGKLTYPALHGIAAGRDERDRAATRALELARRLPGEAPRLQRLIAGIARRDH